MAQTPKTEPPQLFYGPFSGTTPGQPVPEENFWTLWYNGRLTEADTLTIRLGATPSGPTSAHLHHPPKTEHFPKNLSKSFQLIRDVKVSKRLEVHQAKILASDSAL